jgi:catechol 2,3-dioxygenase-like lactoylglutathione lyase family enzyme
MATMRYLVSDVGEAISFYADRLGFEVVERYGVAMAIVRLGDLDLWLAGPTSSAARAMPDGREPAPGGWNRLVITVEDLDAIVAQLGTGGAVFRNEIVEGPGGRQILVEDPAGNVVELFEPAS